MLFNQGGDSDRAYLQGNRQFLSKLAKLDTISWLDGDAPPAAMQLAGKLEILVPLAGLIDVAAEQTRLNKEVEKLQNDIAKLDKQLNNERFVAHAPAEVVAKERDKLATAQSALGHLREQLAKLATL